VLYELVCEHLGRWTGFGYHCGTWNTKAPGVTINADPFQQGGLYRRWVHQSAKSSYAVSEHNFEPV